ncbi:MAG: hypothetical protein DMG35_19905 [Acidobacteria bacterium]|nr:MAG: hypothetical protein AUH86_07580 [Acidobacteria bacterium 13_1_40CM_4_58_4]PYT57641.1 MAG: hypothetical protein DMG35_19905 [Acidobacteriota bacterium]
MKMKTIRTSILCLVVLLFAAPLLRAQDLSKYRHFSIGMNLSRVLERTDQKMADVKVIHGRPALIQELTWWPPNLPGASFQSDTVEQILLSFYNGELYKISVTYDRASTEGLTAEDMVKSIAAKYGPATNIMLVMDSEIDRYDVRQKPVASWEDAQYSFNLIRSTFTDRLGLTIYSKRVNAEAELAIAEAVKLEEQEGPQREAERQKKQTDDLETARQKNRKIFRP